MYYQSFLFIFAYMITVNQLFPPTIYKSTLDGKTYVIPAWVEVPEGTTEKDINWVKPISERPIENWVEEGTIKARRGNTIYKISKFNRRYKCSCSKQFSCNHIKDYLDAKFGRK